MKTTIKTTNLELTPSIKEAIEEKIGSLDKFISYDDNLVKAFVEIALETRHHKKGNIYYAEANISLPGKMIRSEAKREDIYQAINEVKDELQRLLKKGKEKNISRREKSSRAVKDKNWK